MRPTRAGRRDRITVVVCTDGRRVELGRTLDSLLTQSDPCFEVLVVDNAPGSGQTQAVLDTFDDIRLRRVREPRRGLSAARNRGVQAATGELIAFTDDDCLAEPGWLAALRAAFEADPVVSAVTGRTVPVADPTPVQQLFEEFGSFDRGPSRACWHWAGATAMDPVRSSVPVSLARWSPVATQPRIFPYAGVYGSGNNMAFTAVALRRLGPFDEALGAGSPAAGGEDLDMFVRSMLAGMVLIYEPDAMVRHDHRHDPRTLQAQVRSYGSGLSAMITKHLLRDRASRIRILRRLVPGLRHLFAPGSPKNVRRAADFPRALTRIEWSGLASGPRLYLIGRRACRRAGPIPTSESVVEVIATSEQQQALVS